MNDREEIQQARIIVVAAIEATPTCYRPDITRHAAGHVSEIAIKTAIAELLRERVIRMKEDDIEHDWEYRLNKA